MVGQKRPYTSSEMGSQMGEGSVQDEESDSYPEEPCNLKVLKPVAVKVNPIYETNKKLYCICQQEYKHGNLMFQCEGTNYNRGLRPQRQVDWLLTYRTLRGLVPPLMCEHARGEGAAVEEFIGTLDLWFLHKQQRILLLLNCQLLIFHVGKHRLIKRPARVFGQKATKDWHRKAGKCLQELGRHS